MKPALKVVRVSRRRDGLHTPERLRAEFEQVTAYVDKRAPNRRMQLMAFGMQTALRWALNNRDDMNPMRLLDLTQFALKLEPRTRLELVPRLQRKKQQQ